MSLSVVFMGTPEYGAVSLRALIDAGCRVSGVFTQPDRPVGRGKKLAASPVKMLAQQFDIPVFQPVRIRKDGVEALRALRPDVCVTAAFGQILSQEILDIPPMGTVNVHASLLPAYRGSSPVVWSLYNGERETGVTTMLTNAGIDTGDILLQKKCAIEPEDTQQSLTLRLAHLGAGLLTETLQRMEKGDLIPVPQNEAEMSYYPMIRKEMGLLDFSRPSRELCCQVRAFDPWPGSFLRLGEETIKVWKAEAEQADAQGTAGTVVSADPAHGLCIRTGNGIFRILELQATNGKRMRAEDYLRGHKIQLDSVISEG